MWRVYREAGRPIPRFSEDDVIDYMVTEAILLKIRNEEEQAQKLQAAKDWRGDKDDLRRFVGS